VPWCPDCDQYLAPSAVQEDGACPACGQAVDPGGLAKDPAAADEHPPIPWHLKLLAAAVVLYLGFRAWQGVEWVLHQL
jgi:hypothetical protein